MKRYAIVRVDTNQCVKCEHYYINENENYDCRLRIGASFLCDRYGDTKQQLINKIAQVLTREVLADIRIKVDKRTFEEINKMQIKSATKIVEFLGVEE